MAEQEVKKDTGKQNTSVCPLCGSDGYIEADLPNEVKEAYLMSMLGDFTYSGKYPMMDGKIQITVSSPTEKDKRLKLKFVVKIGDILASYPGLQPYTIALDQYIDAAIQIRAIRIDVPSIHTTDTVESDGIAVLKELIGYVPDKPDEASWKDFIDSIYEKVFYGICGGKAIPAALLMAAVTKHNTMANRLLKECLNENFIQGIGQ